MPAPGGRTLRPATAAFAGATAFCAGLAAMGLLCAHVAAFWADVHALHPNPATGMSPETLAAQPPDYLASLVALRLAVFLAAVLAFVLALLFRGHVAVVAVALGAGLWLPPALQLLLTPGSFSSSLGPFAVLVNFLLSAGLLGTAVLAGTLPAAVANRLRTRPGRHRD